MARDPAPHRPLTTLSQNRNFCRHPPLTAKNVAVQDPLDPKVPVLRKEREGAMPPRVGHQLVKDEGPALEAGPSLRIESGR